MLFDCCEESRLHADLDPFFSIIIPTFNRRDYLREALTSVFKQQYTDYEVIVVDDGSTEDLSSVIDEYRDRVRFIRQENAGPGVARNRGAQDACGEYLAFLDSDDLWFPWTLHVYAETIRAIGRPTMLSGEIRTFDHPDALADQSLDETVLSSFTDYFASVATGLSCSSCQLVVRSDAFRRVGGFTSQNINAEDHDLVMRLGTESGFVHITKPIMIGYRCHGGSVTASLDKTYMGVRHLVRQERSGKYPGGSLRRKDRQLLLSRHVRPVCVALLNHGQAGKAWLLFWVTLNIHLRQRRWKFVFAFPVIAAVRLVGNIKQRIALGLGWRTHKAVLVIP